METQFVELKEQVKCGQEEAAAKAVKCTQHERPYSFKKKGNEEQSVFNTKVEESLLETEAELARVESTPVLEHAL